MGADAAVSRTDPRTVLDAAVTAVRDTRTGLYASVVGDGSDLLLLHGTGSSADSWNGLLPALTRHFRVIAPDLPGHARSAACAPGNHAPGRMAALIAALLVELGAAPRLVVGHSAGAAVAAQMCLDRLIAPAGFAAINPALYPYGGRAGPLLRPLARLLAMNGLARHALARRARDPRSTGRLLRDIGSRLDPSSVDHYTRLLSDPDHLGGVLRMMAAWDIAPLSQRLQSLQTPILLITGAHDRAVPRTAVEPLRTLLPHAEFVELAGVGHLAHEEAPAQVGELLLHAARRWGLPA